MTGYEVEKFAKEVGNIVMEKYGYDCGIDLAYNLIETGAIETGYGTDYAAQQVAMHIAQP